MTTALSMLTTVGCGLMAGLFLAFSASVLIGLRRLPPDHGAAAMQAINVAILNPVFLTVFVGTALLSVALIVAVAVTGGPAAAAIGAGLYLGGAVGVTAVANVPLNDALATEGAEVWERYLVRWTRWNHVRTLASTVALVTLVAA